MVVVTTLRAHDMIWPLLGNLESEILLDGTGHVDLHFQL